MIYNTLLVDNDTHKKVEVINSRKQTEIVKELRKFKNIKTVTRDFSKTYKNSITEAFPEAKQIVDRFHILKKIVEHIIEYLKRTLKDTIEVLSNTREERILNERQIKKQETAKRKYELAQTIQELIKEGKSKKEISRILKVSRVTVIKYAEMREPIESGYKCILDEYIPLIKKW